MSEQGHATPRKVVQGEKLRGEDKTARIPVKIVPTEAPLRKPDWIRVRIPVSAEVERIKEILRRNRLASVCEEASCPNLGECFGGGTATFMVMGEICTRLSSLIFSRSSFSKTSLPISSLTSLRSFS